MSPTDKVKEAIRGGYSTPVYRPRDWTGAGDRGGHPRPLGTQRAARARIALLVPDGRLRKLLAQ